jgi:hypothetical protein
VQPEPAVDVDGKPRAVTAEQLQQSLDPPQSLG